MGERSFVGHARTIGLFTLLSRFLGLFRDILCSHYFGAGILWDAFTIAWRIPNLFRRLFGEGALTAAFVPAFVQRWDSGREEDARELFNRIITRLAILLAGIVIAGIVITFLLPLFADDQKTILFSRLLRIMLPYLFLVCIAAIISATLQSLNHFSTPALTPVVLNIVFITAVFLSAGKNIDLIAIGILVGGIFQVAILLPPLLKRNIRYRPDLRGGEGVREVGHSFVPVIFGLALVQVNEIMDSVIAELFVPGHGAVSSLFYGGQVNNLPLSLIGSSIATAVFPALSSLKSNKKDLLGKALRGVFYLAIPSTVGLLLFSHEIIALVFEHGAFEATERTARNLQLYALGMCFYCANTVQVRAFYAVKDMVTPVRVSAAMVVLNLSLNMTLVWPFQEAGIAAATALSGMASFLTLRYILRKKLPEMAELKVSKTVVLSGIASLIMGGIAWGLHRWLFVPLFPGNNTGSEMGRLLFPIGIAVVVYFTTTRFLGMEESKVLFSRIRKN